MGANAVTTVPVYVSGEVLTASDLNITNSGIPVFATTVTRDAAFGGTGEKTLAQGQYAYIEATSTLQVYTGSAWISAGGGLAFVKEQVIGSAVSAITVTGAFSSTYDNYKITVTGGVASVNNQMTMTLGSTATGYYSFQIYGGYGAATVTGANQSNAAYWGGMAAGTTASISADIDLQSPNLAKNTHMSAGYSQSDTGGSVNWIRGYVNKATQYTAFTLTASTGTFTGGTIRVYGYQNS